MTKRVLAFLMVIAMMFSLLPTAVLAEGEEATSGYKVILQKAHEQTEGSLAVDVYLQAIAAEQGDVTGYQFTVTPAEGFGVAVPEDLTGNGNIAGNGEVENVFIYVPAEGKSIAVGTTRIRVATINIAGEAPADWATAFTMSDVTVTTAAQKYDIAEVETIAYGCDHECAHGTGVWTPVTAAELNNADLTAGNYYLVEDVHTAKRTEIKEENAVVNICLNGFTWASADRLFDVDANGATANFCDCTATGTGEDLKAGKLVFETYNWGNLRCSKPNTTITTQNIIIEGVENPTSTGAAATYYQGGSATDSYIYAENVLVRNVDSKVTVVDIRAEAEFKNVTFVNCSGGTASATSNTDVAIFTTNGAPSTGKKGVILDGCKFIDCDDEILFTNGKAEMPYTLKGNIQAETAAKIDSTCKVTLDLDAQAKVIIETVSDKTAETLGDNVIVAEGATIPVGTVVYKNKGMYVGYENGAFTFIGHAHAEHTYANGTEAGHTVKDTSFEAWTKTDSIPTSGNWYLTADVTLTAATSTAAGKTLNLCLNGHTITQTTEKARITSAYGVINLFDCHDEYDAEGNWIGGNITGGSNTAGGAICAQQGGIFNMYGGRISGNSSTSGGAIYISYSETEADGSSTKGGTFNMYGGELYGNSSSTYGGAVTAYGYNHKATSGNVGADPALGLGAKFNMHGGKIHGNTTAKTDPTSASLADGTIYLSRDAEMTMTGGEICNNDADRGGAIYMANQYTKATITGGKIYNNTAYESDASLAAEATRKETDASKAGRGGAIHISAGTLSITDAEIYGNNSTMGGALYVSGGTSTKVDLLRVTLRENYALDRRSDKAQTTKAYKTSDGKNTMWSASQEWGNGGAININNTSNANVVATHVSLKDCVIDGNYATETYDFNDYQGMGGAIYANRTSALEIDGCTFTGNYTQKECGGAVVARNGSTADIKNCTFTDNSAGTAGGAVYNLGSSIVKLTDTVITGNKASSNGGGVYTASAGGRVIVSGKVVVADNVNKSDAHTKTVDMYFQSQANTNSVPTRTLELLEVNELGEGSHINLYFEESDSPIIQNDVASGFVKLSTIEGASQTKWDCGWITVITKEKAARNVSLVNNEFVFGHYHLMPDGTQQEFTALEGTEVPTDGGYYYLTENITANWAVQTDLNLCFNGYTITGGATAYPVIEVGVKGHGSPVAPVTVNIFDCTAVVNLDGEYIGGGIAGGTKSPTYGAGVYVDRALNGAHTLNWYNGSIHDCKVVSGTSDGGAGGTAIYLRGTSGNNLKPIVHWYNGAIYGNTGEHVAKATGSSVTSAIYSTGTMTIDNILMYDNYNVSKMTTKDVNGTTKKGLAYAAAIFNSGTMTIKNGIFRNNSADTADTQAESRGGAIYNNGTLTIEYAEFTGNNTEHYGGAIYNNGGTLTIKGGLFEGNYVEPDSMYGYAGAIWNANSAAKLIIQGTETAPVVFRNNYVKQLVTETKNEDETVTTSKTNGFGGAITLSNGTDVSISYAEFIGNEAEGGGGAIWSGYGSGTTNAVISNCLFDGNTTPAEGGAIRVSKQTAEITDCVFVNNEAADGGAVAVHSSSAKVSPNATISGCEFTDNYATRGGALAVYSTGTDYAPTVNVSDCEFTDNTASTGGVLRAHANGYDSDNKKNYKQPTVNFADSTFTGNYAGTGGVFYTGADKVTSTSTPAYTGAIMLIDGCTITGNSATNAAVVQMTQANEVTLKDTTITGNWVTGGYGMVNPNSSTSKLYVEGKVVIYDNFKGEDSGVQHNVFMRDYDSNPFTVRVNEAGLTEGSKIGITVQSATKRTQYSVTNANASQYVDYFAADQDTYSIVTISAATNVYITQAAYGDSIYATAQKAIDAINAAVAADPNADKTLKLYGNVKANLTSASDLFIDLEGNSIQKLTMAEGTKVTLIDTTTDRYTDSTGKVVVEGAYEAYTETNNGSLKRYLAVKDADGAVSVSRVYLAINSKLLRTFNKGVGFKAIYAGNSAIANAIAADNVQYGIQLSYDDQFRSEYTKCGDFTTKGFTAGIAGTSTPNQRTAVVYDVLFDGAENNQANADDILYGRPYIAVDGVVVATGAVVETSLSQLAAIAKTSGDQTAKDNIAVWEATYGVNFG